MSIINKMLKDIEQRKPQPDIELEKTIEVQPIYDYATIGKRVCLALLLCSVVVVAYVLIPQKVAINEPVAIEQPGLVIVPSEQTVKAVQLHPEQKQNVVTQLSAQATISQTDVTTSHLAEQQVAQSQALKVKNVDSKATKTTEINTVKSQPIRSERKDQPTKEDAQSRIATNVTASKVAPAQAKINVRQISTQERADNWFNKGKEAFKFGLIEDAIIDLDKALTLMPLHIDARSLLAAAYYGRGELAQADAILRQGLRFSPDVMRWRILLAKILTEQQSYESILPILSPQFERYANIDFWILKGTAAQQLGENDIALQCFRKLTQLQPEQAKWWLALASASEIAVDKHNARRYYMTALQLGGLSPSSQEYAQQRLVYLGDN